MSALPPMYLFTGSEELLVRRAAARLIDQMRSDAPVEVIDVRAGELREWGMPDLRTGSLFGDRRAVLIRDAQELPADMAASLVSELDGPPPEATVILMASGTGRIMKLARAIKAAGGRVDVSPPRDWEDRKWAQLVRDEFAQHERKATNDAVTALLGHAGLDVGQIAEKVSQVVAAADPGTIGEAEVERAVVGHGSRGSFAVADAMCSREPARALELLRGVLEAGNDPIMVLGALVYRVRSILAVAGKVDPKRVGLRISGGQARHLRAARGNFGPGELTRAMRTLADADVLLKSGDVPPQLVIERAVVDVATPAADHDPR
ncbi:MAG TPA: DNA polymerase III subunit delta [Euzebyales bacterium]